MWTMGSGWAVGGPARPGVAWRRRRKMSLLSPSALASRGRVQGSRNSGRADPGQMPRKGPLTEGNSSSGSGQLPPSNAKQRAPQEGELKKRHASEGLPPRATQHNQGKLHWEGETAQEADGVCSSSNQGPIISWLPSHPQAGAGWMVQVLELPTQNWSKTEGERLRSGPTK